MSSTLHDNPNTTPEGGAAQPPAPAYAAWLQRVVAAPYRYDFYQLLRHIESAHPHLPRLGEALRPADEPVRVAQPAELTFAPAAVHQVVLGAKGLPRIMQRMFGLIGPNGPLPIHLTELARDRALHHADPVLQRFLDMLTHRFALQFYRAWATAQPVLSLDRPGDTAFARRLGSLFGIGAETTTGRDALGDAPKLFFSARLSRQVRDADGLLSWCRSTFDVPVRVQQWRGHWMPLAPEGRTRLGGGDDQRLGRGAVLGSSVWDVQHKFRIIVGPVGLERYRSFLPGGRDLDRLCAIVRQWVGLEFAWDLQVILARAEVPRLQLRGDSAVGHLGRTSWLGRYRRRTDAADMVVDVEGMLGRRRRAASVASRDDPIDSRLAAAPEAREASLSSSSTIR